jgi:hypothetical protein
MRSPPRKDDKPHQSASGTGTSIAQAYGEGATATVNITGLNPERIALLLQAAGAAAQTNHDENKVDYENALIEAHRLRESSVSLPSPQSTRPGAELMPADTSSLILSELRCLRDEFNDHSRSTRERLSALEPR